MLQRNHHKKVSIPVCDVVLNDLLAFAECPLVITRIECGYASCVRLMPIECAVDICNDCIQPYISPIDVDVATLYFSLQSIIFRLSDLGAVETKCGGDEYTPKQTENNARQFMVAKSYHCKIPALPKPLIIRKSGDAGEGLAFEELEAGTAAG